MKTTFYIIAFLVGIISCSSLKNTPGQQANQGIENDTLRIANDSVGYELIILEPGFNGWLASQPGRGYYSQSTLEIRNSFYVREYNLRVNNPSRFDPNLYDLRINYDSSIDYGYEVNYLLYHWFVFFEQKYDQQLL